jgi:parallel beta-helix repeat protein
MKTKSPCLLIPAALVAFTVSGTLAAEASGKNQAPAAVLIVPGQFATIHAAISAAKSGDTVLVAPGTYHERLKLKPDVIVKSEGDDAKGRLGIKRAEATILDGTGGKGPGVEMAAGAVLDGFTITGVGEYDDALWKRHHATQGNEQQHEHIGQAGTPGIAVDHDCTVVNNIVHHIGYTGIAVTGASGRKVAPRIARNVCYRNMGGGIGSMNGSTAVIENNTCFENFYAGIGHSGASPVVRGNTCYGNIRAGIGISEGSSPTVAGNRCFKNRRAGIGIRTGKDTQPVVENNECFENDMAGIGVEDGASAKLTGNVCTANKAAGIGLRGRARAEIVKNKLTANALVAIGVTENSEAIITDNELAREGGMPPMIAVLDDSRAVVTGNTIRGGGVAGILVKGSAEIRGNRFVGNGPRANGPPNFAVWAQHGSETMFSGNHVERWRHALSATEAAKVVAKDNKVSSFTGTAIVIKNSREPAEVTGNIAISDDPKAKPVEVAGPADNVSGNELKPASKP